MLLTLFLGFFLGQPGGFFPTSCSFFSQYFGIRPILGFRRPIFAATYHHDKNYSVLTNTCIAFYHNMQWNTDVSWCSTTCHFPAKTTTIITIVTPLHACSKGILLPLFICILLLQLLHSNITKLHKMLHWNLAFFMLKLRNLHFCIHNNFSS